MLGELGRHCRGERAVASGGASAQFRPEGPATAGSAMKQMPHVTTARKIQRGLDAREKAARRLDRRRAKRAPGADKALAGMAQPGEVRRALAASQAGAAGKGVLR